jgi:hypothetical protein
MKPAVLTATIFGALAIAAVTSIVVSPASSVSMSSPASAPREPESGPPISAKPGAVVVLETGRAPVPLVRPPNEPARIPPAAGPAPASVAEVPPLPAPNSVSSDAVSRDALPGVDDEPPADQRLHAVLATLPRGPDVRYWIVPLDDGRVRVIVARSGPSGPDGWDDKAAKHRRRGWR